MAKDGQVSPAVGVAKSKNGREGEAFITLPTGDKAHILPVSAALIDEVTSKIKDPPPPMWYNKETDREESNPNDPDYIKSIEDCNRRRGIAALDAMVMFGVELVNGVPDPAKWLPKLKFMAKRGSVDLTGYDLDDPLDLEFLYKRFVAVNNDVFSRISEVSGISGEDVTDAERGFPSP